MIPEPAPAVPDQGEAVLPPVSVIMPVRDEEPYLADSVHRILDDGYAGEIEIVLAVGPSQDRTAQIADELAARDPRVVVVENPTGRTPAGLNAAIRASRHAILVRVDGHGFLPPRYIETAVDALARTGAANVGGVMVPEGRTPFEQAVARAMSSRVGIGGAPFHVGGEAGPTQSVYLGVFRRDVLEELGGFDEHFTRAQDWELNHRTAPRATPCGSSPACAWRTGRARACARSSRSSAARVAGGARSCGPTPRPRRCGTSPRRSRSSASRAARSRAWQASWAGRRGCGSGSRRRSATPRSSPPPRWSRARVWRRAPARGSPASSRPCTWRGGGLPRGCPRRARRPRAPLTACPLTAPRGQPGQRTQDRAAQPSSVATKRRPSAAQSSSVRAAARPDVAICARSSSSSTRRRTASATADASSNGTRTPACVRSTSSRDAGLGVLITATPCAMYSMSLVGRECA